MKYQLKQIVKEFNEPTERPQVPPEAIDEQMQVYIDHLLTKGIVEHNKMIYKEMVLFLAESKLDCREKGLAFFGSVGSGKSVAAKVIAAVQGIDFYECHDNKLIAKFLSKEEYFWELVLKKETIVLDDLGTETTLNSYGNKKEVMSMAITERHQLFEQYGVKTIITSNLANDQIKERYGERIYSRLKHMCKCIGVKGADLRNN